jgi:hypothetical protein
VALNDLKLPVTIEEVFEYREELLRLAWVITHIVNNEDFVHEFYLVEKRRNRLKDWNGKCKLSSWLLTTMRFYQSNINHHYQYDKPLYDWSRPWASWCGDKTSDVSFVLSDFRSIYPKYEAQLDQLLLDRDQKELGKNRWDSHMIADRIRDRLQEVGGYPGDSTTQPNLWREVYELA